MYNIHSDTTRNFKTPLEPKINDEVKVRIRVRSGFNPNFKLVLKKEGQYSAKLSMDYEMTKSGFDYYYQKFIARSGIMSYYFEFEIENKKYYFNSIGISDNLNEYYSFYVHTDYKTPDWAKGAVMYQIFVDRFNNGDVTNDVKSGEYKYISRPVKSVSWDAPIENLDVDVFHGGDIQGIIDKVDYFKELGIEAIYLNPIFVSPSNHKYDIQDYYNIDPHYGKIIVDDGTYKTRTTNDENLSESNSLFEKMVKILHDNGIRVIIDGVFNHCGSFNRWMDSYGIYNTRTLEDESAPYRKYFNFIDIDKYESWWNNDTLPKLNYESSPELIKEIYDIGKKWISPPYNVDGWRLDVAADLGHSEDFNHRFWKGFREEIKSVNSDCYILAEHYGNPTAWLRNGEWDSVMNYDAFMEPVTWFLTGMEKHSDEYREDLINNADAFWGAMKHYGSQMPIQSYMCAMNQLSNHDHSRFLTRTNKKVGRLYNQGAIAASTGIDKRVMMCATVIQMTWIGAPTLYYGDEAGLCGFTDPDNRRAYPWGNEDNELLQFHKDIIKFRSEYKDLIVYGSLIELYRSYGIICYARLDLEKAMVICVNNLDHPVQFDIPIIACGIPKDSVMYEKFQTARNTHQIYKSSTHSINRDTWNIRMTEKSSRIFIIDLEDN